MRSFFSQLGHNPSLMDKLQFFFAYKGRLNRQRYIIFVIGSTILSYLLYGITLMMTGNYDEMFTLSFTTAHAASVSLMPIDYFTMAIGAIQTVAGVTMAIRRLHDMNRTGWWMLAVFIPLIGGFALMIFLLFVKGTEGDNKYGRDPLTE